MKKTVLVAGLMCIAVVGVVWYLLRNLDALVKDTIESAGTSALGSAVTVGSMELDLGAGTVLIHDLRVANPAGFGMDDMLHFTELRMVLDPAKISRQEIGILAIIAREPRVLYEVKEDGTRNLDVVAARFERGATPDTVTPEPRDTEELVLSVASVDITGTEAVLDAPNLPATVLVPLDDIHLQNLHGAPDEIARQLLGPVLEQLSRNASSALLANTTDLLKQDEQSLGSQLRDRTARGLRSAGETISSSFESAREGVRDLFNRDDTAESEAGNGATQ